MPSVRQNREPREPRTDRRMRPEGVANVAARKPQAAAHRRAKMPVVEDVTRPELPASAATEVRSHNPGN